jgi:transmembrane sensor
MKKHPHIAKELLEKYRDGNCTEQEAALVEQWYETANTEDFDLPEQILVNDLGTVWDSIQKKKQRSRTIKLWKKSAVAASILLAIATGFYFNKMKSSSSSQTETIIADVAPGGNKATLTLADGTAINLSDAGNGEVAVQNGVRIYKTSDGQVVYESAGRDNSHSALQQNIISTPYGGQFRLKLPDGSEVFLNAGTTLKYPAVFSGKQRRVELDGEAYFNISHDKSKPFIVRTSGQEVEVLGTRFNVNSYANENMTITTLEEGSVKVKTNHAFKVIKPGQQSLLGDGGIEIRDADMETALAWRDGNIIFKSADIQSILRQVERWYNIGVVYEGTPSKRLFTGGMPRDTKLSVLLDVLKDNNISFRMEDTPKGKKLFVTN